MPQRKQLSTSESASKRAVGFSVAWIVALLAGYWVLADWPMLPRLASSVLLLAH